MTTHLKKINAPLIGIKLPIETSMIKVCFKSVFYSSFTRKNKYVN